MYYHYYSDLFFVAFAACTVLDTILDMMPQSHCGVRMYGGAYIFMAGSFHAAGQHLSSAHFLYFWVFASFPVSSCGLEFSPAQRPASVKRCQREGSGFIHSPDVFK